MSDPLITIIIPVYNVEEFLRECMDSLLNQTYKNIEIIAINDGSTDKSIEILKEYKKNYDNILVVSQINAGQSVARNKGIELAKGKYIYFLDSDDYLLNNTFESLVEKMERNNLDMIRFSADSFSNNFNYISISKGKYDFKKYYNSNKVYNKAEYIAITKKAFSASPVLFLLKREILKKNNIMFKPNIIHEDELFTLEVFLNVNSVMYDPVNYYQRRYREGSTMTSVNIAEHSLYSKCKVIYDLKKMYENYTSLEERNLINSRIDAMRKSVLLNNKVDKKYKKEIILSNVGMGNIEYFLFYNYYNFRKYLSPYRTVLKKLVKG